LSCLTFLGQAFWWRSCRLALTTSSASGTQRLYTACTLQKRQIFASAKSRDPHAAADWLAAQQSNEAVRDTLGMAATMCLSGLKGARIHNMSRHAAGRNETDGLQKAAVIGTLDQLESQQTPPWALWVPEIMPL
jgi:hypothetical protein